MLKKSQSTLVSKCIFQFYQVVFLKIFKLCIFLTFQSILRSAAANVLHFFDILLFLIKYPISFFWAKPYLFQDLLGLAFRAVIQYGCLW